MTNSPFSSCFTGLADAYAAARPSYPTDAIAAILDGLPQTVRAVDIGCGTGISARLLAAAGARVIGFDVNDDMLAAARRAPQLGDGTPPEYRRGGAEATGLADQSVDLILCAQAFHWFEPEAALREFHRILVPHGRLALMWNVRRPLDELNTGLIDLIDRSMDLGEARQLKERKFKADPLKHSALFANFRYVEFPSPQVLDEQGLITRLTSASYFPKREPHRSALLREAADLFARHQSNGLITITQVAELSMADRRG